MVPSCKITCQKFGDPLSGGIRPKILVLRVLSWAHAVNDGSLKFRLFSNLIPSHKNSPNFLHVILQLKTILYWNHIAPDRQEVGGPWNLIILNLLYHKSFQKLTNSSCVGSFRIFLIDIGPFGVIRTGRPVVGSAFVDAGTSSLWWLVRFDETELELVEIEFWVIFVFIISDVT